MAKPSWTDVFMPAGKVLRDAAQGTDSDSSDQAIARAKANPSGVDVAALAQKAADKAKLPATTATPIDPGTAKRDHYTPRKNQ